ncbi:MAG TPA: hypothetical protein PKC09_08910 [Paracoccus sp. (in: a-proteobacteria)]|uniref:hypothetical protein n=1 Tax=uncultured Paracoccus sp. TaxID=189685 RepID=UPI00260C8C48|nr:hypothetical protein [uncultured Paracoccus sp.]HMQ41380.1 hypothetical protein [Paracoccus sp. (in: a-proteobacteria)]HMR37423.1 hypothetical protein [Paracoccus sp. (in: a-proteobacteria)]
MRTAAMLLGVIGGLFAMMVGFFSYGYTELSSNHAALAETFGAVENADLIRTASFLAPLLAIAGGAMAISRALWGGLLLLAAAMLIYAAFGFGVFTMFPIGFCATAGGLAIAAGKPDEPKAHF